MQIIHNSVGNAKITDTDLFGRNDIGLRWCIIAILLLVPAHVGKQEITQALWCVDSPDRVPQRWRAGVPG